jgi:hypothetical protein
VLAVGAAYVVAYSRIWVENVDSSLVKTANIVLNITKLKLNLAESKNAFQHNSSWGWGMKRWTIMQGGNDNGRVFVSSKLPETLQLRLGQLHELFLSCVMLQLFIRSVQSANAKAMRSHP